MTASSANVQSTVRTRGTSGGRRVPESVWGLLLILPAVLLVLGVICYPVVYLARLSITDAHAYLPDVDLVGLRNYVDLATSTVTFWPSVGLTLLYAAVTIALQATLGVVIALLLHQEFRGRSVVRVFALMPYMIPAIVVALVWRWMLDAEHGSATYIMRQLGVTGETTDWLGPDRLFVSLVVVSVWMYTPFVMISCLARLQTINPAMFEAARVDAASAWQRFWHITLPQLRGVLLTLVLLRFMFMFTKFDIIYLFAGTGEEVRTLPVLTFQRIFGEARLGAGATLAMTMFVLLMVFTTCYLRIVRPRAEEA